MNIKILLNLVLAVMVISLISSAETPYPCWDDNSITSNTMLATGSNVSLSVWHYPLYLDPVNITFILQNDTTTQTETVNASMPLKEYFFKIFNLKPYVFYTNYTFYNVVNGIYNISGYSTSANGKSQPFIICDYVCSCEWGNPCPCARNITNITVGPLTTNIIINDTTNTTIVNDTIFYDGSLNYSLEIEITYPENKTYNSNVTEVRFIVTSPNKTAKMCWYNNGTYSSAKASCNVDQTYSTSGVSFNSINGSNNWSVYVQDSMGRINFSTIIFNRNITINNTTSTENTTTNQTPVTPIIPTTQDPLSQLPTEETTTTPEDTTDNLQYLKDNYKQILFWGAFLSLVGGILLFFIINRKPGENKLVYIKEDLKIEDTITGESRVYTEYINQKHMDVICTTNLTKDNIDLTNIGKCRIDKQGKKIDDKRRLFPFNYLFKHRKQYSYIWSYSSTISAFWSTLIAKMFKKTLIVKCDSYDIDKTVKGKKKLIQYLTSTYPIKNADIVIVDTKKTFNNLANIAERVQIIPRCIFVSNIEKMNVASPKKNNIISIGKIEPNRGILDLIDSFYIFKGYQHSSNWILNLIGPTEDKKYLNIVTDRIIELGLQNDVRILGPLSGKDLYKEIAKAKIFISPTPDNNMNNDILLYSLYYGCLPIATDVSDTREILEPLNIKPIPINNIDIMAKAINYYSKSNKDRNTLRKYIENNLDWDIYLPAISEIFKNEQTFDNNPLP